ncbi:ATP-binding protein [Kribbella sp. NPDC051718]|uniref:AlbA family DNA-binding domain-containing protein n=1 Tax=Kribbella sp. NPDC051718 TaxID=3155168 RepID=UPI003430CEBF
MTVDVRGSELAGTSLELFSPSASARGTIELAAAETVSFPLPHGLPLSDTWLWLKADGEWLDYRSLSSQWSTPEQLDQAGVRIEPTSLDQQAALEALIAAGEGPGVEFKRVVPRSTSNTPNPYKTVAAFANGEGGVIIFGVDDDEVTVVGLGDVDPQTERDRLGNLIRTRLIPTPQFEITSFQIEGKDLLALRVQPGVSPPYAIAVSSDAREKPQYYVRRGASTYFAQPSDLAETMRRADATSAPLRSPFDR